VGGVKPKKPYQKAARKADADTEATCGADFLMGLLSHIDL